MKPEEFKRIRLKLGLTQADAADVFGLAGSNVVSNIETGFRKPSKLTVSVLSLLDTLPLQKAKALASRLATKNRSVQ